MAELKTKATEVAVESFLENVADQSVRDECFTIIRLFEKVTDEKATMWGPSIIGFGRYHYKYESGREGDICMTGFSPRKGTFVFYGLTGFPGHADVLAKIGKHTTGKGCLYIKKLADVNLEVLQNLIEQAVDFLRKKYPG